MNLAVRKLEVILSKILCFLLIFYSTILVASKKARAEWTCRCYDPISWLSMWKNWDPKLANGLTKIRQEGSCCFIYSIPEHPGTRGICLFYYKDMKLKIILIQLVYPTRSTYFYLFTLKSHGFLSSLFCKIHTLHNGFWSCSSLLINI